ncbi:hypothetical protein TIFTF001_042055 [Ficus carica]|uniref:Uncharacterized protein n=1 Tax=Ficus carica TaxID=3494 RepID=A0AA87ZZ47_FICCA|nr:hypothetical protein TIFTF001_042038 [Ficus carica]GMN34426.1 hypothetical protein TIFTF001_042055 [Ficus carica]
MFVQGASARATGRNGGHGNAHDFPGRATGQSCGPGLAYDDLGRGTGPRP